MYSCNQKDLRQRKTTSREKHKRRETMNRCGIPRTLVIIKPDAIIRDIEQKLVEALLDANLSIVSESWVQFDLDSLRRFYLWDRIIHPDELDEYLCSQPLRLLVLEGTDANEVALHVRSNFRQLHAQGWHNLMHCPDSAEEFEREYKFLFGGQMKPPKTNNQIEVVPFRQADQLLEILILFRTEERGGFWQPITGNIMIDEEPVKAAARELMEETSLEANSFVGPVHEFDFFDDNRQQHEVVFGAEILNDQEVKLSQEHTEYRWLTPGEAIEKYLKWPGNKVGVQNLEEHLRRQ